MEVTHAGKQAVSLAEGFQKTFTCLSGGVVLWLDPHLRHSDCFIFP